MPKLYTFLTLMLGTLFLLSLAGIDTGSSSILALFGITATGATSSFLIATLGLLALSAAASAIIIGFFTKASFDFIFLSAFATANLFVIVPLFYNLYSHAAGFDGWIYYPILAIFAVLGFGYIWSIVDWVFNRGLT